jgi:hypothetical protein
MIYKFRMISGDNKAFLRDYEIDSNETFLGFQKFIQNDLKYDSNQLASFFLADENWNKGLELTLIDMENEGGFAAIPMDSIKIREIIKEKKERLLYVYDIFNDNLFFIELMDIYPPDCTLKYPTCIASIGEPPLQLDMLAGSKIPISNEDAFDDILNEFDDEEFGSELEDLDRDDEF